MPYRILLCWLPSRFYRGCCGLSDQGRGGNIPFVLLRIQPMNFSKQFTKARNEMVTSSKGVCNLKATEEKNVQSIRPHSKLHGYEGSLFPLGSIHCWQSTTHLSPGGNISPSHKKSSEVWAEETEPPLFNPISFPWWWLIRLFLYRQLLFLPLGIAKNWTEAML